MAQNAVIHIDFIADVVDDTIPVIQKIEMRSASQFIVKRGADDIIEINMSNLVSGQLVSRPYNSTVYFAERVGDTFTYKLAGGYSEGDTVPNPIVKNVTEFPAYPYLLETETETGETAGETADWVPSARTSVDTVSDLKAQLAAIAGEYDTEISRLSGAIAFYEYSSNRVKNVLMQAKHIGYVWRESQKLGQSGALTEAELEALVSDLRDEFGDLGAVRTWFFSHDVAAWTTVRDARQICKSTDDYGVGDVVYDVNAQHTDSEGRTLDDGAAETEWTELQNEYLEVLAG